MGHEIETATTRREGLAGTELVVQTETASTAVAAQARAVIEARTVMALRRPRDIDDARVKLLAACKRPGFAAVARYEKPVGKRRITGPSIRFVEEALRAMGNVAPESIVVYDDADKRIVRVSVTDLEANLTYATDVVIEKTVERKDKKFAAEAISQRINSQGETTYLVAADEGDLLNKVNALVSKALRTNGLRLVPGDIVEEAMDQVVRTQTAADAKDPEAARKAVVDAFASLGVRPSDLAQYLGCPIEQASPAQRTELRGLYAAIRDGETTWQAIVAGEDGERAQRVRVPQARAEAQQPISAAVDHLATANAEEERKPAGERRAEPEARTESSAEPAQAAAAPDDLVVIVSVAQTGGRRKNKDGTAGAPYTRYDITLADGRKLATFSDTEGQKASAAATTGRPCSIEIVEAQGYLRAKSITLIDDDAAGAEPEPEDDDPEVAAAFDRRADAIQGRRPQ